MCKIFTRRRRRGDGIETRYLLRYVDLDGVSREFSRGRRNEVEAFKKTVCRCGSRRPTWRSPHSVRFKAVADKYIEVSQKGRAGRAPLSDQTLSAYRMYLRRHLLPILATEPMESFSRKDAHTLAETLVGRFKTRAAARHAFAVARVIFTYAVEREIIQSNPLMGVRIADNPNEGLADSQQDHRAKRRPPSHDVIQLLISAARDRRDSPREQVRNAWARYFPMLITLITTGMRAGEARGLQWKDVDFERKVVMVRRAAHIMTCEITPLKSKHGVRDIPMPDALATVLASMPGSRDGFVFGGPQSGRPSTHSQIYRLMWHDLCRSVGVSGYSLHSLRHYYISSLLERNFPIMDVSRWAGHCGAEFTLRRYGHVLSKPDYRKLSEAFKSASSDPTDENPIIS